MVSKVMSTEYVDVRQDQYGTKYEHRYSFEDGTVVHANHKTQACPFSVGDEVEYTVKFSRNGINYGSVKKQDFQPSEKFTSPSGQQPTYKKDDTIGCQWAINAAINYLQYQVTSGSQMTEQEIENTARMLIGIRNRLNS